MPVPNTARPWNIGDALRAAQRGDTALANAIARYLANQGPPPLGLTNTWDPAEIRPKAPPATTATTGTTPRGTRRDRTQQLQDAATVRAQRSAERRAKIKPRKTRAEVAAASKPTAALARGGTLKMQPKKATPKPAAKPAAKKAMTRGYSRKR